MLVIMLAVIFTALCFVEHFVECYFYLGNMNFMETILLNLGAFLAALYLFPSISVDLCKKIVSKIVSQWMFGFYLWSNALLILVGIISIVFYWFDIISLTLNLDILLVSAFSTKLWGRVFEMSPIYKKLLPILTILRCSKKMK